MVKKFSILIAVIVITFSFSAGAQIREIPKEVTKVFANQYPKASNIDYKDQLISVDVHFTQDGEQMIASYSNKGLWKGSEKTWSYEKLSEMIKDGFQKSKYADWEVKETAVVYMADGSERYRLKVEKNEIQKKYLYFNPKGRLIRDSITL